MLCHHSFKIIYSLLSHIQICCNFIIIRRMRCNTGYSCFGNDIHSVVRSPHKMPLSTNICCSSTLYAARFSESVSLRSFIVQRYKFIIFFSGPSMNIIVGQKFIEESNTICIWSCYNCPRVNIKIFRYIFNLQYCFRGHQCSL